VFHNGVRVDPEQTEKVIRWALDMFEASRQFELKCYDARRVAVAEWKSPQQFPLPPGEASGVRT